MNREEVLKYISRAEAGEITDILDAAMGRYRALYPDWEITYWAAEKKDTQALQRLADFLGRMGAAK